MAKIKTLEKEKIDFLKDKKQDQIENDYLKESVAKLEERINQERDKCIILQN